MAEHYIGILSGTSINSIDAALVCFDPRPSLVATHAQPFATALREELRALCVPGDSEIERLGRAGVLLAEAFAAAVRTLLQQANLPPAAISAIGSHGQTIRHRPDSSTPFTLQIGDPNVLAARTGIPVVADFRSKDVALGGQGAPLVPAFHDAMFRQPGSNRAVVNIGGIANVTLLPGDGSGVQGFDTGPGNTLLDAWARRHLGQPMDRDGAWAATGRRHTGLLHSLRQDSYFGRPPPKSTGPEHFNLAWLEPQLGRHGEPAPADVQATLVALTAQTIAASLPPATRELFICGGGARNPVLMRELGTALPGAAIAPTDTLGVSADWVEAMAFAWLARQRLNLLPGNCPAVTGARRAAVLGGLFLPG